MTWQFERPNKSQWWSNFDEAVNTTSGIPVCLCKGCCQSIGHPSRNDHKSTTNLKRHSLKCMKLKEKQIRNGGRSNSAIPNFFTSGATPLRRSATNQLVNEEVLKFFVSGNIPFNQADNPHFKQLIEWITTSDSSSPSISRKTVRKHLSAKAKVATVDLKTTLADVDSKISLALDCWTSRNGFAFLGISM